MAKPKAVTPPEAGGVLPAHLSIPAMAALQIGGGGLPVASLDGSGGGSTGTAGGRSAPVPPGGDTTASNIAGAGLQETSDKSALAYIVAWGIVILILMLLNRTRIGHAIIYYLLVLALVVLLVVNYSAITALIAPASGTGPPEEAPNTPPQDTSTANAGGLPAFPGDTTASQHLPLSSVIVPSIGAVASAPRFAVSQK